MGYSIMTPFQTEAEKDKMKAFMDEHFISITTPKAEDAAPPFEDVSYKGDTNDPVLGFDYGAGESDETRDYYFAICYWMAVHGGKKDENERPGVIYDGHEHWTLFVNEPSTQKGESVEVTGFGYRRMTTLSQIERFPQSFQTKFRDELIKLEKVDMAIHMELERLSILWRMSQ